MSRIKPDELLDRSTVMIGWLDSKGVINEWEFKEELEPLLPSQCLSIGFLVE